jgi:hypothetical protein
MTTFNPSRPTGATTTTGLPRAVSDKEAHAIASGHRSEFVSFVNNEGKDVQGQTSVFVSFAHGRSLDRVLDGRGGSTTTKT